MKGYGESRRVVTVRAIGCTKPKPRWSTKRTALPYDRALDETHLYHHEQGTLAEDVLLYPLAILLCIPLCDSQALASNIQLEEFASKMTTVVPDITTLDRSLHGVLLNHHCMLASRCVVRLLYVLLDQSSTRDRPQGTVRRRSSTTLFVLVVLYHDTAHHQHGNFLVSLVWPRYSLCVVYAADAT